MNEPIPDLQELVHHWPMFPRGLWGDSSDVLFYVRVSDAEQLIEKIRGLSAENTRLQEEIDSIKHQQRRVAD